MNIFFTSNCPKECAKYLDDKRVVKMCLETAQMLSTGLHFHNHQVFNIVEFCDIKTKKIKKAYYIGNEKLPAPTHVNHPSNRWIRQTRMNYLWGIQHLQALCAEYTNRYGKEHAYSDIVITYLTYAKHVPLGFQTKFVNCAANNEKGISYKHIEDTCMAYQLYLNDRWETDKRLPTWYGEAA